MFLGLFYTFSKSNQDNLGKMTFLFGLMYWYFGVHAVDLIALLIEEEIEQGTLEQLLMTRTHLAASLFFRIVAQIIFDLFKGVFVFILCMWAFNISFSMIISFRFLAAVFVFFVGLFAMYGFGYIVAGMSLIYKQAASIASISSTLILFFSGTTININTFPALVQSIIRLFPFYWSNRIIESILQLDFRNIVGNVAVLILQLLLWICFGVFILDHSLEIIYEKGTTGNY